MKIPESPAMVAGCATMNAMMVMMMLMATISLVMMIMMMVMMMMMMMMLKVMMTLIVDGRLNDGVFVFVYLLKTGFQVLRVLAMVRTT